jgi:hypothetical protein
MKMRQPLRANAFQNVRGKVLKGKPTAVLSVRLKPGPFKTGVRNSKAFALANPGIRSEKGRCHTERWKGGASPWPFPWPLLIWQVHTVPHPWQRFFAGKHGGKCHYLIAGHLGQLESVFVEISAPGKCTIRRLSLRSEALAGNANQPQATGNEQNHKDAAFNALPDFMGSS